MRSFLGKILSTNSTDLGKKFHLKKSRVKAKNKNVKIHRARKNENALKKKRKMQTKNTKIKMHNGNKKYAKYKSIKNYTTKYFTRIQIFSK